MSHPTDRPAIPDPLADATLTPDQRRIWEDSQSQLAAMRQQTTELERKLKKLEQAPAGEQSAILTRPEFNREVARMLALDERYGGASSVLYFNFERLASVASRYNQATANAATREITAIMLKHIRSSDIIGRLAVDEFGVLLVRCSNTYAWQKAAELAALLTPALAELQGCPLDLAINYGAYTFGANEDVATGLREAAQALTKVGGG